MRLIHSPHATRGGWLLATGLVLSALSGQVSAQAQRPKADAAGQAGTPGFQAGGAMQIAKVEGTLEAMQQGVIKLAGADKKEVFVQSGPETVVRFTAEAETGFLMPGVSVRFTAQFDSTGKPTEPLKELEVFAPNVNRRLTPEQMREQVPGIYQEGKPAPAGAKNLFKDQAGKPAADKAPAKKETKDAKKDDDKQVDSKKPDSRKPEPKKDGKSEAAPGSAQAYRVVGKIAQVQESMVYVIAGQPLQLELAPDCKVTVSADDLQSALSFSTKGDSVSVSGLRNPAQPAIVMAEQITIKAAKKLTQPETPVRGRPARSTKGKDKEKDADNDDAQAKDKPKPKKPMP